MLNRSRWKWWNIVLVVELRNHIPYSSSSLNRTGIFIKLHQVSQVSHCANDMMVMARVLLEPHSMVRSARHPVHSTSIRVERLIVQTVEGVRLLIRG